MHTRQQLCEFVEHYLSGLKFPGSPDTLYAPIRYSLEEGGKRLRPVLMLLAGEAFGARAEDVVAAASAVEVFHNFTLLHDDIMDNAPLRRGRDTVHVRWGANTAILSGDAMIIYAYSLLARAPHGLVPQLLEEFNRMAAEVCEGQQYDMDFEERTQVGLDEYMTMISLKTAALMARAARMGAMIAGAPQAGCRSMFDFGNELGLAFQLQDDLLDSYSDDPSFGKKIGGDIIEGKKSYLAVQALQAGSEADRAQLCALLADRSTPETERVARVRAIYDRLGIRAMAEKAVEKHLQAAVAALDNSGAAPARLEELRELALSMLNRRK